VMPHPKASQKTALDHTPQVKNFLHNGRQPQKPFVRRIDYLRLCTPRR
jgi:hypothetical protein